MRHKTEFYKVSGKYILTDDAYEDAFRLLPAIVTNVMTVFFQLLRV